METKKCYKCKKDLTLTSFAKCTPSEDGLQDMCRDCHSVRYAKKRKKIRKQQKKYYHNSWATNQENLLKKSIYRRKKLEDLKNNNPEEYKNFLARQKQYYIDNPEKYDTSYFGVRNPQKLQDRYTSNFVKKFKNDLLGLSKEQIMEKYKQYRKNNKHKRFNKIKD